MPPIPSSAFHSSYSTSPSSNYKSTFDDSAYLTHQTTRPRKHRASSTSIRPNLASIPASPKDNKPPSNFILPGKRGKVTRLLLVAVIMFPPISIFLLAMLPFILLVSVLFTYSVAWLLYWTMAGPITFSTLLLDPRRVLKINKVVFTIIFSNITLVPIGISLARYRFWTMRGSPDLIQDVHYNQLRPENKLDIYLPQKVGKRAHQPVVVFIYGGAWSSGSRLLYTLVGARLSSMGYLVMIPDYTIHPKGSILDMEQDIRKAVQWAYNNCSNFGGDPDHLYLMGHSAGAHLSALTVLNDCIRRIPRSLLGSSKSAISSSPILTALLDENIDLDPNDILPRFRGMILCSGVYDIDGHYKHETTRGVERISAMGRVMGNSDATFRLNSPTNILQELIEVSTRIDRNYPTESQTRHQNMLRCLRSFFPMETLVLHGDKDQTVPFRSSSEFFMELKTLQLGSNVKLRIYNGMGHEEPAVSLMETFTREPPFRQSLIDEISQFIDGNKEY